MKMRVYTGRQVKGGYVGVSEDVSEFRGLITFGALLYFYPRQTIKCIMALVVLLVMIEVSQFVHIDGMLLVWMAGAMSCFWVLYRLFRKRPATRPARVKQAVPSIANDNGRN
jgi:Mn2+/Fe2+ NRAMP family transporter